MTEAGAYRQSSSAYGTYDQNGNLAEWTESLRTTDQSPIFRGGGFNSPEQMLRSTYSDALDPWKEDFAFGFRVGQASSSAPFAPEIHLQPASRKVVLGQSTTFVVQAAGEPEPTYQWELNGQPIAGATAFKLAIPSVQLEHLGNYSVAISNALGSIRSDMAQLETFPANVNLAFWGVDTDGLWSEPTNWLSLRTPRANDYVVIDRPSGAYTVTYGGDVPYLHSLYSNEPFVLLSSTLNVSNTIQVNHRFSILGGVLENAKVLPGALSGRTVDFVGGQQARLRHVTINADIGLTRFGRVRISDGFVLNGTARLDGPSELIFDSTQDFSGMGRVILGPNGGSLYVQGDSTLTIRSGLTIRGGTLDLPQSGGKVGSEPPFTPGTSQLINEGQIRADVPGGMLTLAPHFLVNRGLLAAESGATLAIISTWTNHGTVTATNASLILDNFSGSANRWSNQGRIRVLNSVVSLGGTFDTRGLGDFQRTGGEVRLAGQLDNRGAQFLLDSRSGSWKLTGGSILSGTVTTLDGVKLIAGAMNHSDANLLDGVTLNGELDLSAPNAFVQVRNGLVLNGPVSLAENATITIQNGALIVGEQGVLQGSGTILGSVTNSGAVSPGSAPGTLQVSGDFIQTLKGRLRIQLAGTVSMTEHAQLNITGKAALAGRLDLEVAPGFLPQAGQSFPILTFRLRQNTFDFVRLPALIGALTWRLGYGLSSVTAEVVNGTDEDRDTIFDQWELLYGLNPAVASDGALDSDGDGLNNLDEFRAGTDPRDPSSVFRITNITADAGSLRIQANAVPGKRYQLQSKESATVSWANVSQPTRVEVDSVVFIDPLVASQPQRFYRIVIAE